jgi:hypothetical protein
MRTTPICIVLVAGLGAAIASAKAEPQKVPPSGVVTGWVGVRLSDNDIGSQSIDGGAPRRSSAPVGFARSGASDCRSSQSARLFGGRLTINSGSICGSVATAPMKLAALKVSGNPGADAR